ncbi:MAG TPA: hypothetical protein VHV54_20165 [Candidatus Binatia bacterium]|nr:hypothetical protein [Candidatus Binatia bacterium]
MVIDFQQHYIPVQLAKNRGLYSETGRTMLKEGGLPATTMHRRLYDLDLQLGEMAEAGVDLSVLSCLLGWSAPLDECRFINEDLATIQKNIRTSLSAWLTIRSWTGRRRWTNCGERFRTWGCVE